jgi:single-stranded-DNA-specific exonuclease
MEASRIREFRLAVNAVADESLEPDDLRPRLAIDDTLAFKGITGRLTSDILALAPFGVGNPRPVFSAERVQVVDGPRRLKDRHLKMTLRQDGRLFRAIAWRAAEREALLTEHRGGVDVAFSLEQNEYRGERSVELSLADFREPKYP